MREWAIPTEEAETMEIKPELLNELLSDCKTPENVDCLYSQLLQRLINRSLEAEMTAHLGYGPGENVGKDKRSNARNGKTKKTVKGTFGELEIETPRDRDSSFEPQLIKKRQIRLAGMEDKILTLYAKGMTTRDIEHALRAGRAMLRRLKPWPSLLPLAICAIFPLISLHCQGATHGTLP